MPDAALGGEALLEQRAAHHDRAGRLRVYDQIPRRPERPADYRSYQLPVSPLPRQSFVTSGYDLDQPDDAQRRGAELKAVGHGGIDLSQERGTPVALVPLELRSATPTCSSSASCSETRWSRITAVREQSSVRDYLVIHATSRNRGGARARRGTARRSIVATSEIPAARLVHLHLEVRRAREGITLSSLAPASSRTTPNGRLRPRNVLPLIGR